jgi:hypothetical protein
MKIMVGTVNCSKMPNVIIMIGDSGKTNTSQNKLLGIVAIGSSLQEEKAHWLLSTNHYRNLKFTAMVADHQVTVAGVYGQR